jgi:hypothetical protein
LNPIRAVLSTAGASVTGSRIPITVNQRPPIHTREPASSIPSVLAASAPSTTVG